MSDGTRWQSHARMSQLFRTARAVAVVAGGIGAFAYAWPALVLATVASFVATTAIVVALFAWFRADDLSRGVPPR